MQRSLRLLDEVGRLLLSREDFHYSGVLDGSRAREVLGYTPRTGVAWPS